MLDYTGRIVVVTGSGRGIGKAIAKRFLEQNATVALLDYAEEMVKATAAELDPTGEKAVAYKCDISNRDEVQATFAAIKEKFGRVDVLVNNAGINRDFMFHKMTPEQFRAVIEVNLFGTVYCCEAVIPGMREQEYGRIINISSTSAHGNVGQANYAASKAGINGFTKTLALESGRKGITVNAIEPGNIDTDMLRTIPAEKLEARVKVVPMQRWGQPEDIANMCVFLGSEEANYVSGEVIIVSGASKVV